jgi:hypothetical protein
MITIMSQWWMIIVILEMFNCINVKVLTENWILPTCATSKFLNVCMYGFVYVCVNKVLFIIEYNKWLGRSQGEDNNHR